jgi:hypothetical protein
MKKSHLKTIIKRVLEEVKHLKTDPMEIIRTKWGEYYIADLKELASQYHSGQWSPFYAFGSSGTIVPGLADEAESAKKLIPDDAEADEEDKLTAIASLESRIKNDDDVNENLNEQLKNKLKKFVKNELKKVLKSEPLNERKHSRAAKREWILNDEGLYNWWLSTKLSMKNFIDQNDVELNNIINNVLSGKKPAHYLKYGPLNEHVQTRFVDRGSIKLQGGVNEENARKIADTYWDVFWHGKDVDGVWNFKTRGDRFCCAVGMHNDGGTLKPAILNVTTTPGRLELIVANTIDELINHNLKEISVTGGVAGYNTPYAFSKKGTSKKALDATKKMGYKFAKNIGENANEHD